MFKLFPFGLLVLMLASCTTSQDVVQDGLFQKRKYFKKGWFVDKPITRGQGELEQGEIQPDQNKPRDLYLIPIPADLANLEEGVEEPLAELRISEPAKATHRTIPVLEVFLDDRTTGESLTTVRNQISINGAPRMLNAEKGAGIPMMATSMAMLLPTALLLMLLLIIQRLIRVNGNDPNATMLALLMGVLGLAALTVI